MRFSSAAVACTAALAASVEAFRPAIVVQPRASSMAPLYQSTTTSTTTTEEQEAKAKTKKEERLRMMKKGTFHRKGFKEVRDDVEKTMEEQFKGKIVDDLKSNNYVMERDGVKVYLAKVRV
jgi:4-hydroxy-3-methylbut-2-enyl diphosphate reductase